MRAFLGFDLPDDVTDALDRLGARLGPGRAVPPEDMHLTLAFFKDATLAQLEELHLELEMCRPARLRLSIQGLDIFGNDPPRSLHACVSGQGLPEYQRKVATLARRAGLTLPHRRFVPHITLARFSRTVAPDETARIGRFLAAHGDFALPPFVPATVTLYQSHLGDQGPRYDILESYDLMGALPLRKS